MEPEKLNLWDRIFNRYRVESEKSTEHWRRWNPFDYAKKYAHYYTRDVVTYKKIDRLTGSVVKIWKEYLD